MFGIWSFFLNELDLEPVERWSELLDLKNLKGESTGYAKVFSGGGIDKAASLSIDMLPFGRYFNINIIPDPSIDVPRFTFEGMLTAQGSQVSLDLFPDVDPIMDFARFMEDYAGIDAIFQEAKAEPDIEFRPSRQAHIRALVSPYFLCAFDQPESALGQLQSYAMRYFDEWLQLFRRNRRLSDEETAPRRLRRERIARTIMETDPDLHMVSQIFGEETTHAIQEATML